MTQPMAIKCTQCKWFIDYIFVQNVEEIDIEGGEMPFVYYCPAFPLPNGIPEVIRSWEEPHIKIRPDQVGTFVFTPKSRK